MGSGALTYFLELAIEDYYLDGGEPRGRWLGKGSERLSLKGDVAPGAFSKLFKGRHPRTNDELVQLGAAAKHLPGWDLTFSAPKSVSVAWSQADPTLRAAVEEAHDRAVKTAVDYLEQNAAFTRRGKEGRVVERCDLVVAAFQHGTSRAQDPQLHTHALVFNVAGRLDGSWGTLRSHDLYVHKMVGGLVYRIQLAHELSRVGFALEHGKTSFEVKGVNKALAEHFSTRSREIWAALDEQGFSGPRAAELAALSTRERKAHVARSVLFERWQGVGREHGFSTEQVRALAIDAQRQEPVLFDRKFERALNKTAHELADRCGHFQESTLLHRAAAQFEHVGLPASRFIEKSKQFLNDGRVTRVRDELPYHRYSTKDLIAKERDLVATINGSRRGDKHVLGEEALQKALEHARKRDKNFDDLNPGQMEALRAVCSTPGSIKVLEGLAGTGKTTLFKVARTAWELQGFKVLGCAVAGRAARELENGTGIESDTLAMTLAKLERPWERRIGRHLKGLGRAAVGEFVRGVKYRDESNALDATAARVARSIGRSVMRSAKARLTGKRSERPLRLDSKTIIVLDEAGMVGIDAMNRLLRYAERAGAKVVVSGDQAQLQAIDVGAPLRLLSSVLGSTQLTHVVRQAEQWMRDAVGLFAKGEAESALALYAENDRVHVEHNHARALSRLVADWAAQRTSDLNETRIVVGTNSEAREANLMAQEIRRANGELKDRSLTVIRAEVLPKREPGKKRQLVRRVKETISVGDQVMFTKKSRKLGVENGDFGVLESIAGFGPLVSPFARCTVRLAHEDKKGRPIRVSFSVAEYKHLTLGYAATAHKLQGGTFDKVFALASAVMHSLEITYVQMTRHRVDCHLYMSQAEAENLIPTFGRSLAKDTALQFKKTLEPENAKHRQHEEERAGR